MEPKALAELAKKDAELARIIHCPEGQFSLGPPRVRLATLVGTVGAESTVDGHYQSQMLRLGRLGPASATCILSYHT